MKKNKIYFTYIKDAYEPVVLFFGDPGGFSEFAKFFRFCSQKINENFNLEEYSMFVCGDVRIVLKILPKPNGMKKNSDNFFEWGLSLNECEMFAKEFDIFASSDKQTAFHQYLDCGLLDDVVVKVSINEYLPNMFSDIWKNN